MASPDRSTGPALDPQLEARFKGLSRMVGNTPLLEIRFRFRGRVQTLFAKAETFNMTGSIKDRMALHILQDAYATGALAAGQPIVEATSGNTGAGLAMVAAIRGYKCIFVMPDKMAREKIDTLRAYGAKVVVCPTAVEPSDPRSYYSVSRRIVEETPGAFYSNQYHNPANPEAHYVSTAPEIWDQTGGEFDVFVSGMGTGGTLSGCGRYFKERNPNIKIVGVDPIGSLYYEYIKTGRLTKPFSYYVEGIGEDFLPSTMNLNILDDIVQVDDRECFVMTRDLVRREGIFAGGSCGAAVVGAVKYARSLKQPKKILVLLPDGAQKYLSKIFNDEWMRSNGFFDEDSVGGTVAHILRRKPGRVITATATTTVREAITILKEHGISQLPILDEHQRHCGIVSELDLLNYLVQNEGRLGEPLSDLINSDYATVSPHTRIQLLRSIFNEAKVVLVTEGDRLLGLLSKIDLIDYLASQQ